LKIDSSFINIWIHGKKEISKLKYLKILLDVDLKIILLNYENIYVEVSSMISNATRSFAILAV